MALEQQQARARLSILDKLRQKGAPSISPYPESGTEATGGVNDGLGSTLRGEGEVDAGGDGEGTGVSPGDRQVVTGRRRRNPL